MTTTITANDEPTEIEADVDKRFSSIVVNLPVQQTGTGTPSPSNPRPFTMWTDVSLYVSDTEEADEPTLAIELPTPMYGGKVDMVRGEIATTYNSKESGTGWEMTEEGQFRCQVSAYNNGDETSTDVADLYAVHYETVSNKDAYDATDDLTCGLATIAGTTYLYVNDAQYTTLESFATHIAEEVFVFRAHIPMSDVTEPHIVYLPAGTSYVWADAGFVDLTVSGTPPLSLPNSLGKPLKAWSVDVLPKQDLHGQDSPWPAGGGKNKANLIYVNGSASYRNLTSNSVEVYNVDAGAYQSTRFKVLNAPDYAGQTLTLSMDCTGDYKRVIARYYENDGAGTAYSSALFELTAAHIERTIDIPSDVPANVALCLLLYSTGQASATSEAKYYNIQLELGSTATSFAPYENLCPIYGTDKLNLFVEESYDQSATPKAVLTLPQTVYTGTIGSEVGESRSKFVASNNYICTGAYRNLNGVWACSFWDNGVSANSAKNTPICDKLTSYPNSTYIELNGDGIVKPLSSQFIGILGLTDATSELSASSDPTVVNETLTAYLNALAPTFVYDIATPTQFPLTSPTIPTPTGTATTWSTAEDGTVDGMEVTYVGKA